MSENYHHLLLLLISIVGILWAVLAFSRWWREQVYHLAGKTILITGASRGLGLVMARQLIDADARVAICARNEAELARAQAELIHRGAEVIAFTCDVTNQRQVEQMIQRVRAEFGAIDILINNAGADIVGPIEDLTLQDYEQMMNLHFWAPLYTTYAVLPQMQQRQRGRIVNISSIGGKLASPHMVSYCASKFALVGLSAGLHSELAKDGIVVTTVCPGFIHSGVLDHVRFKGQHRQEFTWFSMGDALPLMSVSAEKVARTAIAGMRRGAAEVIVPFPVWVVVKLYALFPGLNTSLLGWLNRFLPKPGGLGKVGALGKDSHSQWTESGLTTLSDRAARRNNEYPVAEPESPTEVKLVRTPSNR